MALHDRIKEARKNAGMTQTELGEKIGVAKTTIAGYEKSREPTAAQLGEIADVLGVDVTFLLQDEIKKRYDSSATLQEMEHIIKKYRSLDPYGQEAVDNVLDEVQKLLHLFFVGGFCHFWLIWSTAGANR